MRQRLLSGLAIALAVAPHPERGRRCPVAWRPIRASSERIAAIRAPTLILHARDETLQLYRNAEFAAATIPRARLVSFEGGGHFVMAVQQARIRTLIAEHILGHAGP